MLPLLKIPNPPPDPIPLPPNHIPLQTPLHSLRNLIIQLPRITILTHNLHQRPTRTRRAPHLPLPKELKISDLFVSHAPLGPEVRRLGFTPLARVAEEVAFGAGSELEGGAGDGRDHVHAA